MRLPIFIAIFWLAALPTARAQAPWLTTAAEVRALTPQAAATRRPVRLRGVVTYLRGAGTSDFVLQDATGGVMTDYGQAFQLRLGQEVEVEGHTNTFPPAPRVRVTKLKPGRMAGLPEPRVVNLRELLDGAWEGFFVEVEGVIRAARVEKSLEPARLALDFGPPHRRASAWVSRFDERAQRALRPDTGVRLRGVCLTWKTASWQPFTTFLVVNDPTLVTVTRPAPEDPLALPLQSLSALLAARPDELQAHRQRIRGVVTLHWPDELLVVQNDAGALRIRPHEAPEIAPGDELDAAGFPSLEGARLELQGAVVRRVRALGIPQAASVSAQKIVEDAPHVDHDGQSVRLRAVLRDIERRSGRQVLALVADGLSFDALLPAAMPLPEELQPGSELELTGVCQTLSTDRGRQLGKWPDSFELLLPNADAIRVVGAPPWWTSPRLAAALGSLAVLLGFALLWAFALRRRVEQRTALLTREIRARHDTELLATERQRLAADLHDTLSQTLTGAAFQLEIAQSLAPPAAGEGAEPLALAQRLLDRGRDDLRRAVWDLTPGALVEQGLVPALETAARELADGTGCTIEVRADGLLQAVPDRLAVHLFRAAQEVMSNALRHGHARHIGVRLVVATDAVTLTVGDDGGGFDPAHAPGPHEGHFGLRSLQERMQRLGGKVEIQSSAEGTTVTARVPLEPSPALSPA